MRRLLVCNLGMRYPGERLMRAKMMIVMSNG